MKSRLYPARADLLRTTAWRLAIAGFLPFLFLAVAILFLGTTHPLKPVAVDAFRIYGAVILSFLGGIRWGLGLLSGSTLSIALSTVPAILGWLSIFAQPVYSIAVLLLAFSAQGAWDSRSLHAYPELVWFARLRIALTLLVVGAHLIVFIALN